MKANNTRHPLFLTFFRILFPAISVVAVSHLHAQIVNDGATNTLSNVTNSFAGDVIVGTNGSFTLLVLSDNALLTNSANGFIGRFATAKSNEVRLISSTARWQMGGSLFVGSNCAASRLVVSNGALLEDLNGNLGFASVSSNNSALITGPGSLWTNRGSFSISGAFLNNSPSNQLVVSDSAALVSETALVSGFRNQVLVTGAGSRWAIQSSFEIGGTDNQLEFRQGAGLVSGSATIVGGDSAVLLTGSGTAWTNNGSLSMGFSSSRALLTASNGATLFVGGTANIGALSGSLSNRVSVTDPGTICMVGSNLFVGGNSSANLLAISNGGLVVSSNGFLGATLGGSVNSALVTGAGSVWSNRNLLYIGAEDRDNQLVVSNGAWVISSNGILGQAVNASSNAVVVTGAGSRWTTAIAVGIGVNVGASGSGNRLVISDGGRVTGGSGQMGQTLGGSNNFALVTGSGSVWSNAFDLDIYQANLLVVSNGGGVFNSAGRLGVGGGNNQAIVTGTNSLWRSSSFLGIGVNVSGNRLTVSNGGLASADNIYVGLASISLNNRVVVDGGTLRSTNVSGTAALDVRRGTNVLNTGLIDVDLLLLTNALGKFEFNGGTLVTRGAVINNGAPFVVGTSGATPAIWDVRAGVTNTFVGGDLYIGSNSSFNQLILTNGVLLTNNTFTLMGREALARSNSVTLAGASSRWWLDDGVTVGVFGSANQLVISNGASLVTGSSSSIGNEFISSNNEAVVTGPGSSWTSGLGHLFVGGGGRNNRLLVSDGGQVFSFIGRIGYFFAGTTNNLAVVTGSGSLWSNATELYVGDSGARNLLVVSNSGTASAGTAVYLGLASTSTNNRVVVDGGTLRVTNVSATGTLDVRRGTNVINSGLMEADILLVTNTLGSFELNGGTASVKKSRINNGQGLNVGNGVSPATFILAGNGSHFFDTVIVYANGTLAGNGMVGGPVANSFVVLDGGTLSPGASIGKMVFTNNLLLFGTVLMEISKNGAVLTNDQIQALGGLSYGGALIVTNIGPTPLAAGDKFKLFASAGVNSFLSVTLPPLAPGLSWTNKLSVDGSIEVFAPPAIPLSTLSSGSYTQSFDSLSLSGGSNPWRDNSTLLGWYAAKTVSPNGITNYMASDGNSGAGSLYSFGSTGSAERALGSVASGTPGDIGYGLAFTNDTGGSVSNFLITYTGEQWRNGGGSANTLTFWYRVSPAVITSSELAALTNWTAVTNLNFAAPSAVMPTGFALDGNLATNRQMFPFVPLTGLTVPPGQNVFFRWHDVDSTGTDQGMAVDDLTVTFSVFSPRITSIVSTNGVTHLTGLGESNLTYGIEAASNLNVPIFWQRIGSNTANGSGVFQFTDTNASAFSRRFYRALTP